MNIQDFLPNKGEKQITSQVLTFIFTCMLIFLSPFLVTSEDSNSAATQRVQFNLDLVPRELCLKYIAVNGSL